VHALFDREDRDLMVAFAGCSLDDSPGSNWVQDNGGLPDYICQIARAIKRSGKTTSQAVAIAVSRVKKWAAGVGVDKDTQAKASAALAEWDKLKAKAKGKKAAKDTVKASRVDERLLNLTDYSMDMVSAAWRARVNAAQAAWRKANPQITSYYSDPEYPSSTWAKEIWNTFIIVQSDYGKDADLWKVPYTVDDNQDVTFQEPIEVKQTYVEVTGDNDPDDTGMTDDQLQKLMAATGPCPKSKMEKFLALTPRPSALDRVLALAADAKKDGIEFNDSSGG
jgi:hypothetical protein